MSYRETLTLCADTVSTTGDLPDDEDTIGFADVQSLTPNASATDFFFSEGDGTRTRNHRIDSPVL